MSNLRIPKLSILLPTLIAVWLIGCVAVHGPAIFAYLALHAATTGVFAFLMWKGEQKLVQARAASTALETPASETAVEGVPVRLAEQQAAVA